MKKVVLFIAALSAVLFVGCARESTSPATQKTGISLTVTHEDGVTKSMYNAASGDTQGQFTWSEGDKIGVNAWEKVGVNHWPEPLTLNDADDGKTTGTFENSSFDVTNNAFGQVAFYPWNGYSNGTADVNGTNLGGDGKLYVHLKPSINYFNDNGKVQQLLPLAAKINGDNDGKKNISGIVFQHLGSGIMVKLNDVPAKANKVSLTVSGQNITGWFSISPDDIGSSSIAAEAGENSTVSIEFPATNEARSPMTFVFPLPTLSFNAFTLKLYKESDVIWSKSASIASSFTLSRGDILNMGELTVPDTRTITVGVINYLYNELGSSGWQVHYWGSLAPEVDVNISFSGVTQQKSVGNDYWSGADQTFYVTTATIPIDAQFKVHKGDRWFGGDASSATTSAYVFNYSGDKALYE